MTSKIPVAFHDSRSLLASFMILACTVALGSADPPQIELLQGRIAQFYSAEVSHDIPTMYNMQSPAQKKKTSYKKFEKTEKARCDEFISWEILEITNEPVLKGAGSSVTARAKILMFFKTHNRCESQDLQFKAVCYWNLIDGTWFGGSYDE